MSQSMRKLTGAIAKSKTAVIFIIRFARRLASATAARKQRLAAEP